MTFSSLKAATRISRERSGRPGFAGHQFCALLELLGREKEEGSTAGPGCAKGAPSEPAQPK